MRKMQEIIGEQDRVYQSSKRKMSSDEELVNGRSSYSYKIIDAINNTVITIIWTNTSGEFDDWIRAKDVEEVLLEMNEARCSSLL